MKASQLKKLIARYYRNRASPAERYIIDRWYASFDSDKNEDTCLKDRKNLNELESRIIAKVLDQRPALTWYRSPWAKIAASIALVCSVSLGTYFLTQKAIENNQTITTIQTFTTGAGQRKRITLPDSTKVILNANSKFTVHSGYGEKERATELSGEAYFEVSEDPHRPFTVRTSDLNVRVLGTSFNVKSYAGLENIKIHVKTGRVEVSNNEQSLAVLQADELVTYKKVNGKYGLETIRSAASYSWLSGAVVLDKAGFEELGQAINNIYGLEIKSTDPEVLGESYNLTIRATRSYRQTLEQLCAMINKRYKKEGRNGILIY